MNRATLVGGLFALVVVTGIIIMFFRAYTERTIETGKKAKEQAEEVSRENEIEQLKTAIELYRADNDLYPESIEDLVPKYISKIPDDVEYRVIDEGTGYELCYRPSNQQGMPDVDQVCVLPSN